MLTSEQSDDTSYTAGERAQARIAILNESKILESLDNDKIVKYYTHILARDRIFIVMQNVEGASLKEVIDTAIVKPETLGEDRIWTVFVQLCTVSVFITLAKNHVLSNRAVY